MPYDQSSPARFCALLARYAQSIRSQGLRDTDALENKGKYEDDQELFSASSEGKGGEESAREQLGESRRTGRVQKNVKRI